MPQRLTERYNVEDMRVRRGELRRWPNTGKVPLSDIVDLQVPGGTIYHILMDFPENSGLQLTILVDGLTIIYFELPWAKRRLFRKFAYLASDQPEDIEVWSLDAYRRSIGQGKHRMLLDHAVADARSLLA